MIRSDYFDHFSNECPHLDWVEIRWPVRLIIYVKNLALGLIEKRFPLQVASNYGTIFTVHYLTFALAIVLFYKDNSSFLYIPLSSFQKQHNLLLMQVSEHPLYPNCVVFVLKIKILQTTAVEMPISI